MELNDVLFMVFLLAVVVLIWSASVWKIADKMTKPQKKLKEKNFSELTEKEQWDFMHSIFVNMDIDRARVRISGVEYEYYYIDNHEYQLAREGDIPRNLYVGVSIEEMED